MKEAVIVAAVRTPLGAFGGSLKDVPAVDLGSLVIKSAIERANLNQNKWMKLSWVMFLVQG